MKEKKPMSDNEDEISNPTNEASKSMKKGNTSKCDYYIKGFYSENKISNKNMDILSQFFRSITLMYQIN